MLLAKLDYSIGNIVLYGKGDRPKAEEIYQQSYTRYNQIGDIRGKTYPLLALGNLAYYNYKYDLADSLLNLAEKNLTKIQDTELSATLYWYRANTSRVMKDFQNAFRYKSLQFDSGMHVNSQINSLNLISLEDRYLQEQAKLRSLRERDLFIAIGISLLLLLIFIYFWFQNRLQKRKLQNVKAVLESQENERKRIARDLHDGVGVLLTGVQRQLENLGDNGHTDKVLSNATTMMDEASQEVRKVAHNMMPGTLTKLGLEEALEDLFDRIRLGGKVQIHSNITINRDRISETSEVMLYRIVQELTNNTLKYSNATTIDFELTDSDNQCKMTYKDNGQGFDPDQINEGIGLKSIYTRTDFLNGKLDIQSALNEGVLFEFYFPLQKLAS